MFTSASVRQMILPALLGAFIVQVVFLSVSFIFPDSAGLFGGPIPVGQSPGLDFSFLGGSSTFFAPFFVADVLLTAIPLFVGIRTLGARAAALACLGALVALAIGAVMEVPFRFGTLPFAGLPIPFATKDAPNFLVMWIDCLLFGLAFAFTPSVWRRVTR